MGDSSLIPSSGCVVGAVDRSCSTSARPAAPDSMTCSREAKPAGDRSTTALFPARTPGRTCPSSSKVTKRITAMLSSAPPLRSGSRHVINESPPPELLGSEPEPHAGPQRKGGRAAQLYGSAPVFKTGQLRLGSYQLL